MIDKDNKEQYTEIKNIEWLTETECNGNIRDYDDHKKKIIFDFFKFLNNNSDYIVKE
jgi:hypothetical protein